MAGGTHSNSDSNSELLGLGGGVIYVPLLMGVLGVTQKQAVGTSLIAICGNSVVSSMTYYSKGNADLVVAACLAILGSVCSPLGAKYILKVDQKRLKKQFGGWLIMCAALVLLKPFLLSLVGASTEVVTGSTLTFGDLSIDVVLSEIAKRPLLQWVSILGTGAMAGFAAGLLGVGGGTVMVPLLGLFAGMEQQFAQGTAMMGMLIYAIRASYTHIQQKTYRLNVAPFLLMGSLFGGYFGGSIACGLSPGTLRLISVTVLGSIGVKYLTAR